MCVGEGQIEKDLQIEMSLCPACLFLEPVGLLLVFYSEGWGAPFLADVKRASVKSQGYLHVSPPSVCAGERVSIDL